jgi:hypothetical protein
MQIFGNKVVQHFTTINPEKKPDTTIVMLLRKNIMFVFDMRFTDERVGAICKKIPRLELISIINMDVTRHNRTIIEVNIMVKKWFSNALILKLRSL